MSIVDSVDAIVERPAPGRRRLAAPPRATDLPANFAPFYHAHVERLLADGARWDNALHNAAMKAARAEFRAALGAGEGDDDSPSPDGAAEPEPVAEPLDHPVEAYSPPSPEWIERMIQWRTALAVGPYTELRSIAPASEPGGKPIRRAYIYPNDEDGIRESVLHAIELEATPGSVVCEQTQALRDDRLDVPRMNKRGKPTAFTATSDVARRSRLVIDVDPQTDKGGTARDALKTARDIRIFLESMDWPPPAVISSGRGFHLVWAIDEPVDDGGLVKGLLELLDAWIGSDRVRVDPAMANPCQIRRIAGVVNHKTGIRSRVLRLPDRLEVVSPEQLREVVDYIVETLGVDPRSRKVRSGSIEDTRVESDGSASWIFRRCPPPESVEPSGGGGSGAERLYVDGAIRRAVDEVEAAETGARRNTLFRETCAAIELLNTGYGDPAAAYRDLFFAGRGLGLDDDQIADQLRGAAERVGSKARNLDHIREIGRPTIGRGFAHEGDADDDFVEDEDDDDSPSPDGQTTDANHPGGGDDEAVAAFPVEVFPELLAQYCRELAGAMASSTDFAGVSMLTVAGAAIGHSVNLRVKKTWLEGPQIWGVLAGPPGTLKSPVMAATARPLDEVDSRLRKVAGDAHREWLKKVKAKPKKGEPSIDAGPEPPRLAAIVGDVTQEVLAVLLRDNPRGLLSLQDEAVGWVASFDTYKRGGGERQFLLSLHSFSPINLDRKGDRESTKVPRPGCGLLTGIQPDLIPRLVSADGNDGFTERLLIGLVAGDGPPGITDHEISDEALEAWERTIRGMAGAPMREDRNKIMRPWEARMTPEAYDLFRSWFGEWSARWWSVEPLREFINKSKGHALRLALILSRLRIAAAGESITGYPPDPKPWTVPTYIGPPQHDPSRKVPPVELVDVEGAIKLMDYFLNHRRRVLPALGGSRSGERTIGRILGWIRRGGLSEFSEAELFDKLRSIDRDEARAALGALVEREVIARIPVPESSRGRKPSPRYRVDREAATAA